MASNRLREGYTTGSCAAAAAKAAAMLALGMEAPESVSITTPEDRVFTLPVLSFGDGSCGVIKDAGDDPDSTDGILIKAAVALEAEAGPVRFLAGEGVGMVTLPGLKVPPGEPAINPAPREMIECAVRGVIGARGASVTVSAPEGEARARKTFNPRLGIVGGISILGTTGRVKPMDESAVLESISLEINTHAAQGRRAVAMAFAGTGEWALRRAYSITNRAVVQCGNYLGFAIDEAARLGIERLLIGGHPGKLLKAAAGSFRTHNREGGGALEALCTQAALAGASAEIVKKIYESPATEAAISVVSEEGLEHLWAVLAEITAKRCALRNYGEIECAAAYIDNGARILGASARAAEFAAEIARG